MSGTPNRFTRALRSPGCLGAAALLVLACVLTYWVESIGGGEVLIARYGPWSPLLVLPIHAVISASPLPGEMVVIAEGAAFGYWRTVPLAWLGWVLASALEYQLSRRSAADVDFDSLFERLPGWLKRFPVEHPAFQIMGRWIPFGFHVVNIASGARRVPRVRHLVCAGLGSVPPAFIFAGIGAGTHWF